MFQAYSIGALLGGLLISNDTIFAQDGPAKLKPALQESDRYFASNNFKEAYNVLLPYKVRLLLV